MRCLYISLSIQGWSVRKEKGFSLNIKEAWERNDLSGGLVTIALRRKKSLWWRRKKHQKHLGN
jgi:hypothetical protein